jgi:EAL domain-containing protein (putative c-di-GMP-specific phosphodiesterase class I)
VICLPLCVQHLTHPVQFDRLQKLLAARPQVLHRLSLGFAEFELMKLNNTALSYLHNLKRLGVRLTLENFGADMMPLGLLTGYPFDFVRLEASFCRSLLRQSQKRQLLDLLITLAQNYKFRIIADGIDDHAVRELLVNAGCCYLQGQLVKQLQPSQQEESVFLQQLA